MSGFSNLIKGHLCSASSTSEEKKKIKDAQGTEDAEATAERVRKDMEKVPARLAPKDPNAPFFVSPAFDESVIGYPEDHYAERGGVNEILEVVAALKKKNIPSCLVAEAALQYFGAGRIKHVSEQIFSAESGFLRDITSGVGFMRFHGLRGRSHDDN